VTESRVLLLHNRYRVVGGEERSVELQVRALEHAGIAHALLERRSADSGRIGVASALLRGGSDTEDIAAAVRALDALQPDAARARGDAREAVLLRVASTEVELVAAATAALSDADRAGLEKEAEAELAPFRQRMAPEAYAQARRAAIDRLVRLHFGLPDLGV